MIRTLSEYTCTQRWYGIGGALMSLAIVMGAFGAHALKGSLDPYFMQVYEKAVFYQLTQSLGLIVLATASAASSVKQSLVTKICSMLSFGILIFSGSLYALVYTQLKWIGAITPIGGLLMILAWTTFAWICLRPAKMPQA